MAQISRNKKDSEWELILESGSNEIVLSDSDGWAQWRQCSSRWWQQLKWELRWQLVKTTTSLEFWWWPPFRPRSRCVEDTQANPTWVTVFLLFLEVIHLLVAESNKYYNQYSNTFDTDHRPSQLPDMSTGDICIFGHSNETWHQGHVERLLVHI